MPSAGDQICTSGTVNPGVAASIILDFAALAIPGVDIPAAFGIIFDALGIFTYTTSALCSNPPRYPGDPSFQDLIDWYTNPLSQPALALKYQQWALYQLYPIYCTCSTFVSPITSYPPGPSMPTGTPPLPSQNTPPDLTCSLSEVSNKLNSIIALLRLLLATVGPQTYSLGTSHTVSGEGEISVSGVVGCITHPLSYAPGVGYEVSDPTRYFDVGSIAFGDSNAWYERRLNIHDPQFHTGAPTGTTRIGFTCGLVTSMEITELLPAVIYQGN